MLEKCGNPDINGPCVSLLILAPELGGTVPLTLFGLDAFVTKVNSKSHPKSMKSPKITAFGVFLQDLLEIP